MAKKDCEICGKKLGMFSEKASTKDGHIMCGECKNKAHPRFSPYGGTFADYQAHLEQVRRGNEIYERIFKPRINEKQDEEGTVLKGIFKKNNSDETVRRYGLGYMSVWAVEDLGLILIKTERGGVKITAEEKGNRNLVFKYSELASFHHSLGLGNLEDNNDDYLHLRFTGDYPLREIPVRVGGPTVYDAFANYFSPILSEDKVRWEQVANNALGGL